MNYISSGDRIFITNPVINYKLSYVAFVYDSDLSPVSLSGTATISKVYFGISTVPIFTFGKRSAAIGAGTSKKQACSVRVDMSQAAILASVSSAAKTFLEKIDLSRWTPTGFNGKKAICIQIDTNSGMNNIVVELNF